MLVQVYRPKGPDHAYNLGAGIEHWKVFFCISYKVYNFDEVLHGETNISNPCPPQLPSYGPGCDVSGLLVLFITHVTFITSIHTLCNSGNMPPEDEVAWGRVGCK